VRRRLGRALAQRLRDGPYRPRPRTRYARSGALRLAYEVHRPWLWGRQRPWLLLVQGLGYDRAGWDPVVPGLRRHFRLVLHDNRGSGASDRSATPFSVTDLARDAVAVLDAAGIERAHVLGVSLGGMIAQEVAIGFPDRVDRLVLGCTTPGWPSGYPMPSATLSLLARGRTLSPAESARRFTQNALAPGTVAQHPELVARLLRHRAARPHDAAGWAMLNAAGARYYGGTRATTIRAATLVLHGTDDLVVDPRNGALLADRIPHARLHELPGLGHLFFWERPAALTEPVSAFLLDDAAAADVPHTGAVSDDGEEQVR
jgi:pimeloyl-ACP methyl ester carboxylesterase